MKFLCLIFILLLALAGHAQTLTNLFAATNFPGTANGSWQGVAGVPGGIDQYSTNYTLYVNVKAGTNGVIAYGDGIHDDTAALNYFIQNCPNQEYVYMPTGQYLITSPLSRTGAYNYDYQSHPFSIIVRGDGPTNTVILQNGSGEGIYFQAPSGLTDYPTISSGNTRGSTSLSITNDFPGMKVGQWITVVRDNFTAGVYAPPTNDPEGFFYTYQETADQMVRLTNISGAYPNVLSFSPPLNESSPNVNLSVAFSYPYRCGIENLKIVRLQDDDSMNIRIAEGEECWIRNVESAQAEHYHISLEHNCAGCEVRQCYVHDPFLINSGGGNSDYGIVIGFSSGSCLIEDNIALHCRHAFVLETGAGQDNVIAYNYAHDNINEGMFGTDYQEDTDYHGGEPRYNLWEGNAVAIIRADTVEGVARRDTYFRNYATRDAIPSVFLSLNAVNLQRGCDFNVLCDNVYALTNNLYSGQWSTYSLGTYNSWCVGDPDTGQINNSQDSGSPYASLASSNLLASYTLDIKSNNIFYGNFDLCNSNADLNIQAIGKLNFTNVTHFSYAGVPSSLLYTNKPAWFGTNVWPPFGGDVAGYQHLLPAQTRAALLPHFTDYIQGYTITTHATNGTLTVPAGFNGTYYNTALVATRANPDSSHVFAGWTGYPVANASSAITYVTMPAANVSVTANFILATNYTLTVSNGSGSGSFRSSTALSISAATAPPGQQFAYWQASTPIQANTNSATITVIMPPANLVLTAIYTPITYYTLTVNGGYSDGGTSFPANTLVSIHAGSPPSGESFNNWTGYTVANTFSGDTTLVMPASNVTVTAGYNIASGSLPDQTVTSGLVAWWKFDEGSGTNITDSSGNGNNGYLMGSPTPAWVAGKYGNALQFDGVQSYAVGGTSKEPFNSNFSVSYWASLSASPAGTVVSTWENAAYKNNWRVNWNGAAVNGIVGGPYNTAGVCNISLTNVPTSGWHHYVLTVDFVNKQANYFIDGIVVSSNFPYGMNSPAPTAPNPLSIGSTFASSPNSIFNGALDDLRIYSRVLSTAEIQSIYLGSAATRLPPPSPPAKLFVLPH
jgi:hypothetical protein